MNRPNYNLSEHLAFAEIKRKHPNAIKNGLRKTFEKAAFAEWEGDEHQREYIEEYAKGKFTFVPDATEHVQETNDDFNGTCNVIVCYEINNTCPVSEKKLKLIRWFALGVYDLFSVLVRVIETDKNGNREHVIFDTIRDQLTY